LAEVVTKGLALFVLVTVALIFDVRIRFGRRGSIWGVFLGSMIVACIWAGAFFIPNAVNAATGTSGHPIISSLGRDGVALFAAVTVAVSRELLLPRHRERPSSAATI
jgi:hypothetical protein